MRLALRALALAGALAAAVAGCSAPPAGRAPAAARSRAPVSYYLSLGDSLAAGVQPDASGASVRTSAGYADQLYRALRRHRCHLVTRPVSFLVAEGAEGRLLDGEAERAAEWAVTVMRRAEHFQPVHAG